MGKLDTMIGAHALALNLILATNDQAFRRIKKLKLKIGRSRETCTCDQIPPFVDRFVECQHAVSFGQ